MTLALIMYRLASTLAEPFAPMLLKRRVKAGKERAERLPERLGRSKTRRPTGPLVWMHAASVGESQLLLTVLREVRALVPNVRAVMTTQTLTSADMVARSGDDIVIHQMAPVDAPGAVGRFLDHWRPDAVVFAEGEIWPNLLLAVGRRKLPAALINARMTDRSIEGWVGRLATARKLFGVFGFVGAADPKTAGALDAILGRQPDVIGNLKRAMQATPAAGEMVERWRAEMARRRMLLAASTHEGEEDMALDALEMVRKGGGGTPLLVIAPRHPERGKEIAGLCAVRGLRTQLRSQDRGTPGADCDVLVADTLGEMMLWFEVADGVFLGGASVDDVGGHNPMEPAQLRQKVFCGPYGFNFQDTFDALEGCGALVIGRDAKALATFWGSALKHGGGAGADWAAVTAYLAESKAAMTTTVGAINGMLEGAKRHA